MKKQLLFIFMMLLIGSYTIEAQTYVGSEACSACHSEYYNDWVNSGHPYKFSVIENNEAPTYPSFVNNFESSWISNLGDGSVAWSDIAGVIGGFGWKARFVGNDGVIVGTASSAYYTGGHNQFNFYDGVDYGWVDYDVSHENKIYNYSCFKCHTTGGDTTGTWLTGVDGLGTFTEGGVGCEACHGPGSDHVSSGGDVTKIDRVYEQAHLDNSIGGLDVNGTVQTPDANSDDVNFMCGTCHNRSYTSPVNSSGGFIKHHEQWDELTASPMHNLTCTTCHDPHKRVIWDGDGITKTCESCHATEASLRHHPSTEVGCIDCHMPYAAKSGTKRGESGYVGDIRSHIFAITVDDNTMFTDDSTAVRDDATREASLSLHFVCLGCHNNDATDNIPEMTLAEAVTAAEGMHEPNSVFELNSLTVGVYPNPAIDNATIRFNLSEPANTSFEVYNNSGQLVYSIINVQKSAGNQYFNWNITSNSGAMVPSGIYYIKVIAGNISSSQKLIITK